MALSLRKSGSLHNLAEAFVGQEHVDLLAGMLERFARSFGGDPGVTINVTSANTTTPAILPDYAPAQSAILFVTGPGIAIRFDGVPPVAGTDLFLQQGSYMRLTGQPSIKGVVFVSASASPAGVTGCFFT